jgi:hypothetical protein
LSSGDRTLHAKLKDRLDVEPELSEDLVPMLVEIRSPARGGGLFVELDGACR